MTSASIQKYNFNSNFYSFQIQSNSLVVTPSPTRLGGIQLPKKERLEKIIQNLEEIFKAAPKLSKTYIQELQVVVKALHQEVHQVKSLKELISKADTLLQKINQIDDGIKKAPNFATDLPIRIHIEIMK